MTGKLIELVRQDKTGLSLENLIKKIKEESNKRDYHPKFNFNVEIGEYIFNLGISTGYITKYLDERVLYIERNLWECVELDELFNVCFKIKNKKNCSGAEVYIGVIENPKNEEYGLGVYAFFPATEEGVKNLVGFGSYLDELLSEE